MILGIGRLLPGARIARACRRARREAARAPSPASPPTAAAARPGSVERGACSGLSRAARGQARRGDLRRDRHQGHHGRGAGALSRTSRRTRPIHATGDLVGHTMEAQAPAGVALAAGADRRRASRARRSSPPSAIGAARARSGSPRLEETGNGASRQTGPPARRRHRHGRGHLPRPGQGRHLGRADGGQIRHPPHRALSHRGPAHHDCGHHRLGRCGALLRAACCPSGSPCWRPRRRSASRAWRQEDFPGALFIAVPPVEMEWPQREALAEASGQTGDVTYKDLLKAAATGRFKPWHDLFIFGTVADRVADRFGTKGSPISLSTACSSGATAIQLGVEAIRRGETDAALCIGTDGSVNPGIADPLLAALGALDPEREPGRRLEALLQEPRRLRHGRGRRGARAGERREREGARRDDPRLCARLRREGRRLPPHPLVARTACPAITAIRAGARRCRPRRRTTSTTSTPTAPRRRRTTRWRP